MIKLIISFYLFLFLCFFSLARGAFTCSSLFLKKSTANDTSNFEKLNSEIIKKWPELLEILKNPDSFTEKMDARFNQAKIKNPLDPYSFEYIDVVGSLLLDMNKTIDTKSNEIREIIVNLTQSKKRFNFIYRLKYSIEEAKIGLKYLGEIQKELSLILKMNSISYRQTIELMTFYTRLIGHFDRRSSPLWKRMWLEFDDYIIEGYKQLSIKEEYEIYQKRDFRLFRNERKPSRGFKLAEDIFLKAAFDPQKLNVILIPTKSDLDENILMSLLSRYKISLIAVAPTPVLADGFLRPSGQFWNHDMRHESAKYYQGELYAKRNNLTPIQRNEIREKIDYWYYEMKQSLKSVKDEQLKNAIIHIYFNFHHDRGYAFTPSTYLNWNLDHIPFGLQIGMLIGGQKLTFKNPKYFWLADKWLREFWESRLEEELNIINKP